MHKRNKLPPSFAAEVQALAPTIVDELRAQFGGRVFCTRDVADAPPPTLAVLYRDTRQWGQAPKTWAKLLGWVAGLSEGRLRRVDFPEWRRARWHAKERWQ